MVTQNQIDIVELAWMRLCKEVMLAAADQRVKDAMTDMGWTLEGLLNDCQAVVDKED